MPNRYSNIKPCPICGRKSWRSEIRTEPVDKTGVWTYSRREVEYRVCPCGHEERFRVISEGSSFV